ncbi:MAG: hypothetical protein O7E52_26205 [Candidatus Poribacteria bacterium]|nr:hypothetical protein [Candidatus Poribacteria bacterium]
MKQQKLNSAKSCTTGSKYPPHTRPPAIKPGSYSEYLHQHPEVVEKELRAIGIDPDELMRMLLEGGTVIMKFNNSKNATITKVKEET